MKQFTIHREKRQKWAWSVRWCNGKPICRANIQKDAKRIADALNYFTNSRNALDDPLTEDEVTTIQNILKNET